MSKAVRAAGAVVLRRVRGELQVAVIHRPRYNDWTLPKGKFKRGESPHQCAVREVLEETGLEVRLDVPLDAISYKLPRGDRKTVHYWRASVVADRGHRPDREVDEVVWLSVDDALIRLTHDAKVLAQACQIPDTTPLLIVRHGKAITRKHWGKKKNDQLRPLAAPGREQAARLPGRLTPWHVQHVTTSVSLRCAQTVEALAASLKAPVVAYVGLSEEDHAAHPGEAEQITRGIARAAARRDQATVVCGHRPVLPDMLAAIGLAPRTIDVGDIVVAHVDHAGLCVAIEHITALPRTPH